MSTNPPGRTNSAFDPFNHDASGVDPTILAVPPYDPYTLVAPGHPIQVGDIKRIVGDGHSWVSIEPHEVGHPVPTAGIAYGRVEAPEGYVVAAGDDSVGPAAILWSSAKQVWLLADDSVIGANVGEMQKASLANNLLIFVAHPDPQLPAHRASEIPTRHRQLYPGEKLRRGDKLIYDGKADWESVTVEAFGMTVTSPDALNGEARYCRPVEANFQTWYVGTKGNEQNMGGAADPWPSVTVAMHRIEQAAASAGVAPHGLILENGIPKMVYDSPEPADRAGNEPETPGKRDPAIDGLLAKEDQRFLTSLVDRKQAAGLPLDEVDHRIMGEIEKLNAGAAKVETTAEQKAKSKKQQLKEPARRSVVDSLQLSAERSSGSYIPTRPELAAQLGCTVEELLLDADRQVPRGYRKMAGQEEFAAGDLMYQFDTSLEAGAWLPVPEGLHGAQVWFGHDAPLFIRKTITQKNMKAIEFLNQANQQYAALGETLKALADVLKN